MEKAEGGGGSGDHSLCSAYWSPKRGRWTDSWICEPGVEEREPRWRYKVGSTQNVGMNLKPLRSDVITNCRAEKRSKK